MEGSFQFVGFESHPGPGKHFVEFYGGPCDGLITLRKGIPDEFPVPQFDIINTSMGQVAKFLYVALYKRESDCFKLIDGISQKVWNYRLQSYSR